jgi:hypothetical protein
MNRRNFKHLNGRGGHLGGRLRELFGEAVDAYRDWNTDEPEPTVTLEPMYEFEGIPGAKERNAKKKDRVLTISQVCGLLWNCADILPGLLVDNLAYCGLECGVQYKHRTYSAAARAIKREIS